jgi:plastocyanin
MMKKEFLSRFLVVGLILVAIAVPVVGDRLTQKSNPEIVELHARMEEDGGWSLKSIRAKVGQPLRIRLTSDDVVHGFAVGKSDQPAIDIMPGEYTETTLTFDHPGVYTFYCTRWCGTNHWRMRGKIEVTGPGGRVPEGDQPLYIKLGIDIDAPHLARVVPAIRPSAERGALFADLLPAYATTRDTYMATSPSDLWLKLRDESSLKVLSDNDLWDAVRWIWERQSNSDSLSVGLKLFISLAAAAHGETGKGDGVMVQGLPTMTPGHIGHELVRPPDFTDPHQLLGASPALLEGKIIRGGMGTGMPSWGAILTTDQIDAIVGYLYTIAWNSVGTSSSGN